MRRRGVKELFLIGIGSGNPEHLTLQAVRAMNGVDAILIPRKGAGKADLADLRRAICADVVTNTLVRLVEFYLPERDEATPDYLQRVEDWHNAIAQTWEAALLGAGSPGRVALLVWGDPSLYDSTLRIAARLAPAPRVTVIAGITSLQALTAAHRIPVNGLGAAFTVTTGRNLRDAGWPVGVNRIAVMLDGDCSFAQIAPEGVTIYWAAYAGMAQEVAMSGDLAIMAPQIIAKRAELRAAHGWIMDIYILDRV
jgi:precorrin-6A synthase